MAPATAPTLLTAREAAAVLGVSVFTIRRMAAAGSLAPVRLGPRSHLRFRREDVEALTAVGPRSAGAVEPAAIDPDAPRLGARGALGDAREEDA